MLATLREALRAARKYLQIPRQPFEQKRGYVIAERFDELEAT